MTTTARIKPPRWLRRLASSLMIGGQSISAIARGRIGFNDLVQELLEAGPGSFLIVLITALAAGTVFNIQVAAELSKQGASAAVGGLLALGLAREIAPLLTATLLTGKVATAYAAQLGTMKVTEQIDALRALAVHPIDYLVVPRFLAMLVSMPLLVAECIGIGIFAAYLLTTKVLGVSETYYLDNMLYFTGGRDVAMGLIKGMVFGVVIVFVSCHQGLNAREGAVGVGRATTEAVVIGSLFILVVNFFLTMTLNIFFPAGK